LAGEEEERVQTRMARLGGWLASWGATFSRWLDWLDWVAKLSRTQAVLAFGLRLPPEDGLVPRYSFSVQRADCAGQNSTPNINFGTFCSNTNALIYYI